MRCRSLDDICLRYWPVTASWTLSSSWSSSRCPWDLSLIPEMFRLSSQCSTRQVGFYTRSAQAIKISITNTLSPICNIEEAMNPIHRVRADLESLTVLDLRKSQPGSERTHDSLVLAVDRKSSAWVCHFQSRKRNLSLIKSLESTKGNVHRFPCSFELNPHHKWQLFTSLWTRLRDYVKYSAHILFLPLLCH